MFKAGRRVFGVTKSSSGKAAFVTNGIVTPSRGAAPAGSAETAGGGVVATRSNHQVISAEDTQENLPVPVAQAPRNLAVETSAAEGAEETAAGSVPGGGTSTDITTHAYYNDVLFEFFGDGGNTYSHKKDAAQDQNINQVYRDIYYSDPVCGSAVDLMSTLPFSEFSLTGLKDQKMLDLFVSSTERMRVTTLLPTLSIDYMVLGAWIGSLSWDEQERIYTAITPQNLDFVDIVPVPIYGIDPLLSLRIPPELADFLNSNDERVKQYTNLIPSDLRGNIGQGAAVGGARRAGKRDTVTIPLSTDNTIFIPRQAMLKDYKGVSYYRRVLVPWLIEKALMRGTLDQVYKRQRSISHVTAGDEEWKPSNEEMQQIANLFLNADLDPVGAFVVTRNGISVNDIRAGGEFWRWDQSHADLSTIKLRALGINEAFITGEANYSTMEATLSVFMEQIRNYRATITREMFYDKCFPMIAKKNDVLMKKFASKGETASVDPRSGRVREILSQQGPTKVFRDYDGQLVAEVAAARSNNPGLQDIEQYVIPEVQWHKRLMPEADQAYLDMLAILDEKGVPIPIRVWAAAGGQKIQTLLEGEHDDLEIRRKVGGWKEKIKEINKEFGITPPEEMEGGPDFEGASSPFGPSVKRIGLLNRNFDQHRELAEVANLDSRGKRRVTTPAGRKVLTEKVHRTIAEAASRLAQQENAKPDTHKRERSYSYKKREEL